MNEIKLIKSRTKSTLCLTMVVNVHCSHCYVAGKFTLPEERLHLGPRTGMLPDRND